MIPALGLLYATTGLLVALLLALAARALPTEPRAFDVILIAAVLLIAFGIALVIAGALKS